MIKKISEANQAEAASTIGNTDENVVKPEQKSVQQCLKARRATAGRRLGKRAQ